MLQSTTLANQFKPAILQCFGDIAGAIGGHFETYLSVVAQVLEQASTVTATPEGPDEMFYYVISLREGIMDAWGGIIGAMKSSGKSKFGLNSSFSLRMALTYNCLQPNFSSNTSHSSSNFSTLLVMMPTAASRS
jgi:hypothetical protein